MKSPIFTVSPPLFCFFSGLLLLITSFVSILLSLFFKDYNHGIPFISDSHHNHIQGPIFGASASVTACVYAFTILIVYLQSYYRRKETDGNDGQYIPFHISEKWFGRLSLLALTAGVTASISLIITGAAHVDSSLHVIVVVFAMVGVWLWAILSTLLIPAKRSETFLIFGISLILLGVGTGFMSSYIAGNMSVAAAFEYAYAVGLVLLMWTMGWRIRGDGVVMFAVGKIFEDQLQKGGAV